MSDGMTDCADHARAAAHKLAAEQWPGYRVIQCAAQAPAHGTVIYIYETWLDHVIEVIENRLVVERWMVGPGYLKPQHKQLDKPADNGTWQVGYYQEHTLYDKF
ncbi:MAG: hypothetical protein WC455_17160 [Dehalococcoidia bacterium]|jgi:hypothetical protein